MSNLSDDPREILTAVGTAHANAATIHFVVHTAPASSLACRGSERQASRSHSSVLARLGITVSLRAAQRAVEPLRRDLRAEALATVR